MIIKETRTFSIGGAGKTKRVEIGGTSPISIQTMWKEGILSVKNDSNALISVIDELYRLQALGCDIMRFAVPDMTSAESLCIIAKDSPIPLVADIHFDYRLALKCIEGGVHKIRINPGNIGDREKVRKVVSACKDRGIAIRIGVNTGSLPQDLEQMVENGSLTRASALSQTALREASVFDELGFYTVVVSMKASSVRETIEANEEFASKSDIPLHIGVTEAGPLIGGIVKSTMAFTHLLKEGIGSTIRVSLSSSAENEVITAREILRETGHRKGGVHIVSCPRCGRNGFNVHAFVNRWQNELLGMNKDITVAVMGCVVNGPGEGKHADIGITGAGNSVIIFRHGETVRTVKADPSINNIDELADTAFREELHKL